MAYDLLSGKKNGRDWSCGFGLSDVVVVASDANREVDQASSEMQALTNEIHRAKSEGKISNDQFASFKAFHKEFYGWRASTGTRPYGKLKFGLAGIFETAKLYRGRIADWRKLLSEKGVEVSAPSGRGIEPPKKPGEGGGVWKWLAIAGAGAATFALISRKL